MIRRPFHRAFLGGVAGVLMTALASAAPRGMGESPPRAPLGPPAATSPVSGMSWIHHLHVDLDKTSIGSTGGWGVASASHLNGVPRPRESLDTPFLMTGRDLYRLSCQSCHREDGSGAPPEILPITALARATSREFFRDKMKERGLPVDEAQLAQNTAQAETSLRDRIRKGGEKMPPFPDLDQAETDSLIAYVKELSGVPEPGRARPPLREPVARVGELLVKGTCHICHDASATPTTAFENRMGSESPPALSFFTEQRTSLQVIRKVREGLAEPNLSASRGRMPVFGYLSPQEVTAAYLYLLVEPPGRARLETAEAPERSPRPTGGDRPKR